MVQQPASFLTLGYLSAVRPGSAAVMMVSSDGVSGRSRSQPICSPFDQATRAWVWTAPGKANRMTVPIGSRNAHRARRPWADTSLSSRDNAKRAVARRSTGTRFSERLSPSFLELVKTHPPTRAQSLRTVNSRGQHRGTDDGAHAASVRRQTAKRRKRPRSCSGPVSASRTRARVWTGLAGAQARHLGTVRTQCRWRYLGEPLVGPGALGGVLLALCRINPGSRAGSFDLTSPSIGRMDGSPWLSRGATQPIGVVVVVANLTTLPRSRHEAGQRSSS